MHCAGGVLMRLLVVQEPSGTLWGAPDASFPASAAAWPPPKHSRQRSSANMTGAFDREHMVQPGTAPGNGTRSPATRRCDGAGSAAAAGGHLEAGWPPRQNAAGAMGLEATVQALGGFIEDDMPTFSEFKRVRASRKGLLPS